MDGCSAKKSTSLETLVIQNITNVNDLKAKLNDVIRTGKDYEYDVSSCLKSLVTSSDQEIVLLTIQAISELAKCENKRQTYAEKDIIDPIVKLLQKDLTSDTNELVKQCCRALGNLCCDCDASRKILLECNGVPTLIHLLEKTLQENSESLEEIKMFSSKTLLNFAIGGKEFSGAIVQGGVINLVHKMLLLELEKDDMNDDTVSTAMLLLSVINDFQPEYLFDEQVNNAVLRVLGETTNIEISEMCLDHLYAQVEHDSVKTWLAKESGAQLVCFRLEQLVQRHEAGDLNAEDSEVETIMKQACDLVTIVLTGDEAMHILYDNGTGELYQTMVRWLDSHNHHLLNTAVLAVGNFARQDDFCAQMMENKIFDKLLDIFDTYQQYVQEPDIHHPRDPAVITRIQHAVVSALRNLMVPKANKKVAAANGRAAPALLKALPRVKDHLVAYKMLGAIRMLIDGQEEVAAQVAQCSDVVGAIAAWGRAGEHAGAGGEAPRLLAWLVRAQPTRRRLLQVDGCVSCLVNMIVASHSVMQNEALTALTMLATDFLQAPHRDPTTERDLEEAFVSQLVQSEIGKHICVLLETNCMKMPETVIRSVVSFMEASVKNRKLALDFKTAKVHEALQKCMDARAEFREIENVVKELIASISEAE